MWGGGKDGDTLKIRMADITQGEGKPNYVEGLTEINVATSDDVAKALEEVCDT